MANLRVMQVYTEGNKAVYFNVGAENGRRTIADANYMRKLKQAGHTFRNVEVPDRGKILVNNGVPCRVLKLNPVSMQNYNNLVIEGA